jgi:hypothetical protein
VVVLDAPLAHTFPTTLTMPSGKDIVQQKDPKRIIEGIRRGLLSCSNEVSGRKYSVALVVVIVFTRKAQIVVKVSEMYFGLDETRNKGPLSWSILLCVLIMRHARRPRLGA